MSTFIKSLVFLCILNLTFYVGLNMIMIESVDEHTGESYFKPMIYYSGSYKVAGDIFDVMFDESEESYSTRLTNYDYNLSANITSFKAYPKFDENLGIMPSKSGGEGIGTNIISFLDALDIVWVIISTIMNFVMSPITLMIAPKMNPIFLMLIGVPYAMMVWFSVTAFIRGSGD